MVWNLTSPDVLADPGPTLARMRGAGPLAEVRVPLIGRVWVTTTDAAARALLKDPRFRRDPRAATGRTMRQTLWFLPRFLSPLLHLSTTSSVCDLPPASSSCSAPAPASSFPKPNQPLRLKYLSNLATPPWTYSPKCSVMYEIGTYVV